MELKDIDYSYSCFLQEAFINLESAEILYSKEKYSKSVMLFRQSVEMSCKYLGLLWKIIPPSDGKKNVGYIPNKIFKDFFSIDVLKQIKGQYLFEQFENEVNSYTSLEDKINYLINEISTTLHLEVIKRKENQSPIDAMTTFFRAMGFKGVNIENLENKRGDKKAESETEEHRLTVNKIGICVLCQMFMSFLIWGNIEDTNYPDISTGKASLANYPKTSIITRNLTWFFDIQRKCLNMMNDFHQNRTWLNSI